MNEKQFNPANKYGWKPDEQFIITGLQFEKIHNSLAEFITGQMSIPSILKLAEAFSITQTILKDNVENGKIQEITN